MIKLNRGIKPKILQDNEHAWLEALKSAISTYGSYSSIPEKEKSQLISHYRHDAIKDSLFLSSFEKCAFCECKPAEGGNIEVEHFLPKSIHPNLTFEWNNLLPSCRKCNGSKLDHDTAVRPLVNPYDTNPEDVFHYTDIRISPRDQNDIGKTTIEVFSLNSVRLMRPRADILISLNSFCFSIEDALNDYYESGTDRKRSNRLRKISEAIEGIEQLTLPSEKYSGFCKSYLNTCEPYLKAKSLLELKNTP